jgi:RNA polymerase sigma factor (sigma-70 family)
LKLLATMARNKVATHANRQRAQRRDNRRLSGAPVEGNLAAPEPSPSKQVAARELLQEVHRRLSPDERQLVTWRSEGRDWAEIAAEMGSTPEALRKKLARALGRISEELGLDDESV